MYDRITQRVKIQEEPFHMPGHVVTPFESPTSVSIVCSPFTLRCENIIDNENNQVDRTVEMFEFSLERDVKFRMSREVRWKKQ